MCGILGYLGKRTFSAEAFGRALDLMKNRGPDDRGIHEEPEVLLGHRRLSILDLSPSGHQPMSTPDGRYTIVFNGEVYNYKDLRQALEAEGVRFSSSSDTEVILALYASQGPDCLNSFRGMFALAIWDARENFLFLARDRMGIKPLYVWPFPGGIAFASEVKVLRALPGGPSGLEPRALAAYLAWGSVPEPKTILSGVSALGPGTWGLWRDGVLKTETYWSLPSAAPTVHRRDEVLEMLRPLLKEAVALRCISDAPLGAFLSGGVDSSSVVSLMRAGGQRDLRTFSVSFPQTAWDEGSYALKVAEEFGTLHTDVSVTEDMVRNELKGFFTAMDQPTCDGVNTFLVSKFARQGGLTVSLSGLGGDELFAGYPSFRRIIRLVPWLSRAPRILPWAAAQVLRRLDGRYVKLEVLGLPGTPVQRLYHASRGLFMPSEIRALLNPDFLHAAEESSQHTSPPPHDPLHETMFLELRAYMLNQLLRDSDVFGMAQSLEIRVPLIDHKLIEAIFQIAPEVILEQPPKSLLMQALPKPLPKFCTHRPKMGFTFPFDAWMRGSWKGMIEEGLLGNPGFGHFGEVLKPKAIAAVWGSYLSGKLHWSRPWSLYVLNRHLAKAA